MRQPWFGGGWTNAIRLSYLLAGSTSESYGAASSLNAILIHGKKNKLRGL